ncbi:MAG: hypothetical protein R6V50_08140 [Thermoplasmatota archaeon]
MKKILPLAVVLLFIGVALAPSINSSVVEDELVEIEFEFSGLGEKHSVSLTAQEADEIETLFDEIEQRLSKVKHRKEADELFHEAIDRLDELNVLPKSMSKQKAKDLVTGQSIGTLLPPLLTHNTLSNSGEYSDLDANYLCLIAGESTEDFCLTWYQGLPFRLINIVAWYIAYIGVKLNNDALVNQAASIMTSLSLLFGLMLFNIGIPYFFTLDPFFQRPLIKGGSINYGVQELQFGNAMPSTGWVSTYGLNGFKNWTGDLYGQLEDLMNWPFLMTLAPMLSYPGVSGFFGLVFKYTHGYYDVFYPTKYLGYAIKVKLGPEPPRLLPVP